MHADSTWPDGPSGPGPRWRRALPDAPRRRYTPVAGTARPGELGLALHDLLRARVDDGALLERLEARMASRAGCRHAISFGAGRMALYVLLEALGLEPGDEVVLPGFTCVVVPNAMLYHGLKPVYADIEPRTFNLDPAAAEAAITERTRALILQHTFGVTADVERLTELARRRGLRVIEDFAHSLGAKHGERLHGGLGDAGYVSTDRTKVVNTQLGGFVTTNDDDLAARLRRTQARTPFPARGFARRVLLGHLLERTCTAPAAWWLGRPLAALLRRAGAIRAWSDELATERPGNYPLRMPSSQARLGLSQLEGLEANLAHRRTVARWLEARIGWYGEVLGSAFDEQAWLRYSFLVRDREAFEHRLRGSFDLGVWFTSVLYGRWHDLEAVGYRAGSCPVAERAARQVVNFPTQPRLPVRALEALWRRHGDWIETQVERV